MSIEKLLEGCALRSRIVSSRGPKAFSRIAAVGVLFALGMATHAQAQAYRVLHDFNLSFSAAGSQPRAPLVQGPDGALYGTTSAGNGQVSGAVFRILPDGQGYSVIKAFHNTADGALPFGGLVVSGSMLYGTTSSGGAQGAGALFKVGIDGTGFAVLHSFPPTVNNVSGALTNSEGVTPYAGLVLAGTTLYGTAFNGGEGGGGTVFRINTDGTGFAVLKHFSTVSSTNTDGANPQGSLVFSGGTLYGTTLQGGSQGGGTVFKIGTDGTGFAVLASLSGTAGYNPCAGLVLGGATLYGTTYGSAGGSGTVFKVNTNGLGFGVLWSFPPAADNGSGVSTNSSGAHPYGGLVLSGSTLYGTALGGGSGGAGTLFRIETNGTGFALVRSFSSLQNHTNSDGASSFASLCLSGMTLYGTAFSGGNGGQGAVFKVNQDGSAFSVLKAFPASDGQGPQSTLVLSGSTLFGTAGSGGAQGLGSIFKLNTDGSGFAVLRSFDGTDGAYPYEGMVLSGTRLFGAAGSGGRSHAGTLFQMNTDGTGFGVLTNFPATSSNGAGVSTNSIGSNPQGLTLAGSTLYGSAGNGGNGGGGTVFKVQTDGSALTVLKHFAAAVDNGSGVATNSDGAGPNGSLVLAGARLYGTTYGGGINGCGTVFAVNTDGTGFAVLRHLDATDGANPAAGLVLAGGTLYGTASGGNDSAGTVFAISTNGTGFTVLKTFSYANSSDGINPLAALTLAGDTLYGTTYQYGGVGTLFRLSTNGTGFQVLKSFSFPIGAFPRGAVTLADNTLYGTTAGGGVAQSGVVFSLSLVAPQIVSTSVKGNLVTLVWESFPGVTYRLQSATSLSAANWTDVAGDVTATGPTASASGPFTTANCFYRVVALP